MGVTPIFLVFGRATLNESDTSKHLFLKCISECAIIKTEQMFVLENKQMVEVTWNKFQNGIDL